MISVDVSDIKIKNIDLNGICEKVVAEMLAEGEAVAIDNLGHIDTGETLNSIHTEQNGNEGKIVAGGNAIWLEFGTGVIKNPVPHPEQYKVTAHGQYGKGHGKDPNGWNYPVDGGFRHTKGIAQTRFMWNTSQYLKFNIYKIARKALK